MKQWIKKIVAGFAAAALVFGSAGVLPEGIFDGFNIEVNALGEEFEIDENGVLTQYNGAGGDVVIPDSVTSIGQDAFYNCTSVTSITIPDSVTSIGNLAFRNCKSLTSITIPGSVTSIGNNVFFDCSNLTSINVADNNSEYSSSEGILFNKDKTNLIWYPAGKIDNSYTIPNSVTSIGDLAFDICTKLTSVTIPNSVTSIGMDAFWACSRLTSVNIPTSVTSIEYGTFYSCARLTSITIPDSVTSIGDSAFEYCAGLTSISIPNSVTSIGNSAFERCTSLTSIAIPDSVTSIGNNVFECCTSLTSIAIPEYVTYIGKEAFTGCTSLTSITIPDSVTSIEYNAFGECISLKDIYFTGTEEQWNAITIDNGNRRLMNATIHLGEKTLTIDSISPIQDYAYTGFEITPTLTVMSSDTVLTNGTDYTVTYRDNINIGTATVVVTGIGNYSGEKTAYFKIVSSDIIGFEIDDNGVLIKYNGEGGDVVIPNSVTSIGNRAFSGCSSLTSITIPNSVTSIGDGAFGGCTSLTSITFPDSVTYIGLYVFRECTSLTSINVDSNNPEFSSTDGIIFNKNKTMLKCYPVGKTDTSYTIPNSVTFIGESAFYGCTSLSSITISESVQWIGDCAFYGCTNLTSIAIPNSVTSIGHYVFRNCKSLTSITIPNSVTWIPEYALAGCTSLTSINIPKSVTRIYEYALAGCTSLTSITIPNSVTEIRYRAFDGCTSLKDIYFTGTEVQWNNIEKTDAQIPYGCIIHYNYNPTADAEELPSEISDSSLSALKTATDADEIKLVVTESEPTDEVKSQIKATVSDNSTLFYLDVELLKVVGGVESNITETAAPVEIKIELPDELKPAAGSAKVRDYLIVRIHNGVVDIIYAKFDGTYLIFSTDKFSDYAISYIDLDYGDVNGDNKINAKDVLAIRKYLVGNAPGVFYMAAGDVNADNLVNAKDVLKIRKYIVDHSSGVLGQK